MYLHNEFIVAANLALAFISLVVNWRAAHVVALKQRPVFMAISVLSGLYVIAFAWLLFLGAANDERWTSIMRGFALLAWSIVWIIPAWKSIKTWQELKEAVARREKDERS